MSLYSVASTTVTSTISKTIINCLQDPHPHNPAVFPTTERPSATSTSTATAANAAVFLVTRTAFASSRLHARVLARFCSPRQDRISSLSGPPSPSQEPGTIQKLRAVG